MKKLYSWDDVAKRTEIVYDRAVQSLTTNLLDRLPQWVNINCQKLTMTTAKLFCIIIWCSNYKSCKIMFGFRPRQYHYIFALTSKLIYNSLTHLCNGIRYLTCGVWAGKLFCLVLIINYLLWCLLEFLQVIVYPCYFFLYEIWRNPYTTSSLHSLLKVLKKSQI